MWKVHFFWVLQGLIIVAVCLPIAHWIDPTRIVFLTNLLCSNKKGCSTYKIVLSALQHDLVFLYIYFTYYMYDVLPISFSLYAKKSMKVGPNTV